MRAATLLATAGMLLVAAVPAFATEGGLGDLRVTFDGELNPNRLPRAVLAPVAVRVAGNVKSASGNVGQLPQLRRIAVGINRAGRLFDRGLPVCDPRTIQPGREPDARRICGGSIVGHGHVAVQVRIPGQLPFLVRANLLAFNGPRRGGAKLIYAQVYARQPPGSFILTFQVRRRPGTYGTTLTTTLPVETREWAYMTHFDMTLRRVYSYRGIRRSYISAACAAPPGFHSIEFPFARAAYTFSSGQRLTLSESEICRVAGG